MIEVIIVCGFLTGCLLMWVGLNANSFMERRSGSRGWQVEQSEDGRTKANARLRRAIEDNYNPPGKGIDLREVRAALAQGADPNMELEGNLKYPTLLVKVALFGDIHLPIIRELVEAGAELHDMPEGTYTPADDVLGTALMQRQYEAAALLIDLGADVKRHGHFIGFLSDLSGGANKKKVALAKKMFDAGGNCDDEMLEELRGKNYDPVYDYQLSDEPGSYEPGAKNLLHLVKEWMTQRRASELEGVWQQVAPSPARARL